MAWTEKTFVESVTAFTAPVGNNIETGIKEAKEGVTAAKLQATELTPAEVSLGEVSGSVSLDLSKYTVFRATVKGATTFKFTNHPARPVNAELLVTQDGTGGREWTVESIEWVNGEPTITKTAGSKYLIPVVVLGTGTVIGFGAAAAGGSSSLIGQTTATVTAIGENAGGAVTGAATTVVGTGAGAALTTGEANTAVGNLALTTNKTGKGNVAVGDLALNKQTGNEATGVGYEALSQSTANNVTAVGSFALASNTTGTGNTAVGRSALFTNKTGTNNTAVGANVLEKATSSSNVGMGASALAALTTGGENTAIGHQSMDAATEAVQNVAVGRNSLGALTTGVHNVGIGYNAGGAITVTSGGTFIGWEAGATETTGGKLYINAGGSATPLIFGDGEKAEVGFHGVKSTKAAAITELGASPTSEQIRTAVNQIIAALKGKGVTS